MSLAASTSARHSGIFLLREVVAQLLLHPGRRQRNVVVYEFPVIFHSCWHLRRHGCQREIKSYVVKFSSLNLTLVNCCE